MLYAFSLVAVAIVGEDRVVHQTTGDGADEVGKLCHEQVGIVGKRFHMRNQRTCLVAKQVSIVHKKHERDLCV